MKNLGVVFSGPNKVEVKDLGISKLKPDEVLIKTEKTLISTGTETILLSGKFPKDSVWDKWCKYPFIPGYCNIGEVVEIGSKVDSFWKHKKVASYASHAQYAIPEEGSLRSLPEGIPSEEATFFAIAQIVLNGIRRARICLGESTVVFGLGLLGQLCMQFLKLSGARPIIGVDLSPYRRKLAQQCGASFTFTSIGKELTKQVISLTKQRMADVVFEITGNPKIISQEFAVLHPQGRLILLSSPYGKTEFDFNDLVNLPSHTIIGAHEMSAPPVETPDNPWTSTRNAEFFFDLLKAKEVKISPLISHRFSYTQALQAYELLMKEREKAMGIILNW